MSKKLASTTELNKAISGYKRYLKTRPSDDRGVRYDLAPCLFEAERYEELEKLLDEFKSDPSSWLIFTRALYHFKTSPGSEQAQQALELAMKTNPYVFQFFAGLAPLPAKLPAKIGVSDDTEAACYVTEYGYQWNETEGAMDWMNETAANAITELMNDPDQLISLHQLMGNLTGLSGSSHTAGSGASCCDNGLLMSLEQVIALEAAKGNDIGRDDTIPEPDTLATPDVLDPRDALDAPDVLDARHALDAPDALTAPDAPDAPDASEQV